MPAVRAFWYSKTRSCQRCSNLRMHSMQEAIQQRASHERGTPKTALVCIRIQQTNLPWIKQRAWIRSENDTEPARSIPAIKEDSSSKGTPSHCGCRVLGRTHRTNILVCRGSQRSQCQREPLVDIHRSGNHQHLPAMPRWSGSIRLSDHLHNRRWIRGH